jgi:hypothetical protein
MPDDYRILDVRNYIISNNTLNKLQLARVDLELNEFEQRNLIDLLRFLMYFIDTIN